MTERITPQDDSFFSSHIKDSFEMNESFKTDPSLATSARERKESGSYLCASNVTPTAVRFLESVFLCLLCFCRMSSTQMTCSQNFAHFRKNRPKKDKKTSDCRSRIISKNRPVPIFGRSTGVSLVWVLPALLQRLKGGGSAWHCSDHTPHTASNWSACRSSQKEASSKDDSQESLQTVCWRQVD